MLPSSNNLRESNEISAKKAIRIGTAGLLASPYFIAFVLFDESFRTFVA